MAMTTTRARTTTIDHHQQSLHRVPKSVGGGVVVANPLENNSYCISQQKTFIMASSSSLSSPSSETTIRIEHLFCLYGSQTGNSEQHALDFCRQLDEMYTPAFFQKHNLPLIQVKTTCIQLDDFLELRHAAFTKCLVIFVSSYGVGQAPLGAYKFRSLAEKLLERNDPTLLQGLSYAIAGLGDSTYTTFLKNPTTIDQGLTAAGATRMGEMAKADAHQIGDLAQDKVIAKWVEELWVPLAEALTRSDPIVNIKEMQAKTIPILMQIDPDYTPPKGNTQSSGKVPTIFLALAVLVALLAILVGAGILKLK
jgi:sulfite reductase alpha subunit-like flavoprotein